MNDRAAELIVALDLIAHPEGGYFREVFRSRDVVVTPDGRTRSALTTIYFLLTADGHSAWHRVSADEVWHHYEGAPLELLTVDPGAMTLDRMLLGNVSADAQPVRVVPAGHWQAARTTGDYTLVGCTVGPGFDFADFTLLRDDADAADQLQRRLPDIAAFL